MLQRIFGILLRIARVSAAEIRNTAVICFLFRDRRIHAVGIAFCGECRRPLFTCTRSKCILERRTERRISRVRLFIELRARRRFIRRKFFRRTQRVRTLVVVHLIVRLKAEFVDAVFKRSRFRVLFKRTIPRRYVGQFNRHVFARLAPLHKFVVARIRIVELIGCRFIGSRFNGGTTCGLRRIKGG